MAVSQVDVLVDHADPHARRIGAARYPLAFLARLPRFPKTRVKITTERRTYESDALAVFMAAINIFGGFLVTRRMLAMFQKS